MMKLCNSSHNEKTPLESRVSSESVDDLAVTESGVKRIIPPSLPFSQVPTDSSPIRCELMGSFVPEYQKYEIELLANMGPHSALPASPNGTTRTGDRSTCLGIPARKGLELSLKSKIKSVYREVMYVKS